MAIGYAMVIPSSAKQIGKAVGLGESTLQRLILNYNKYGASAIDTPGSGGGKNAYLTLAEEKSFLEFCGQKANFYDAIRSS